jgi:hypothetical protein
MNEGTSSRTRRTRTASVFYSSHDVVEGVTLISKIILIDPEPATPTSRRRLVRTQSTISFLVGVTW